MNNNKGFTLIELLVVVLIIGILAAMALPQYFRAVERSRMTEAVTLLSNIDQSQQRKWLQINKYTSNLDAIDVVPSGATGASFYTKKPGGTPATNAQGFQIKLGTTGLTSYGAASATAVRVTGTSCTTPQYRYSLRKFYNGNSVTCLASNTEGKQLCIDFCGLDIAVGVFNTDGCCNNGKNQACTAGE